MRRLLKPVFERMFAVAEAVNHANILRFCRQAAPVESLLDLGCHSGEWTLELARVSGAKRVEGAELVAEAADAATARGVVVHRVDLNRPLPLPSESFGLIHSNQVIEHLNDVDLFVAEVHRLLKPGGVAVISTENASSWHNVFAAMLGWQIFSLTNVSAKVAGLGNPLAIQRHAPAFSETWRHKTIMSYRGLKELLEVHGFADVRIAGAGYYPLPAAMGRVDARHSAFMTATARKAAR